MKGGQEVMDKLIKGRSGGMPWMVILSGDGEEIISSSGPDGNIGCPVSDDEIAYFVEMLKTGSDASEEHLEKISAAMKDYAKTLK